MSNVYIWATIFTTSVIFEKLSNTFEVLYVAYTQYGPIKNGCIKNQHSDFEKNKEPVVRILGLKNRFTF